MQFADVDARDDLSAGHFRSKPGLFIFSFSSRSSHQVYTMVWFSSSMTIITQNTFSLPLWALPRTMNTSTIHITFTFPRESLPKFYVALKKLQEHVIAEPDCVYFNCFELPKQAGVVRIVEIWSQDKKWRKEVSLKPFLVYCCCVTKLIRARCKQKNDITNRLWELLMRWKRNRRRWRRCIRLRDSTLDDDNYGCSWEFCNHSVWSLTFRMGGVNVSNGIVLGCAAFIMVKCEGRLVFK